jgi:transglutaminase-like putative cysteine protease
MALGEAGEILESDRLELRVTGDNPDYLRGKVYDLFDGTRWIGMNGQVLGPSKLETTMSGHVQAERPSAVYYSPLGTGVVASPRRADGTSRGALRGSWDFAKVDESTKPPPPTRNDTQLPSTIGADVRELAREWTQGANTETEKLEALMGHLRRDFHYSLKRERVAGSAFQDFLFVHRQGHCEFFASALAVLARTLGIPTRTVGGFRVVERGPLGQVWLVREKHAHAWVEAYVDGEWTTWDPTPPGAMLASTPPTWERVFEGFREGLTKLAEPKVYVPSGLAVAVVAAVVALVRRARARRAKKVVKVHPELVRLEAALARDGLLREPSEGLLVFAERLEAARDLDGAEAVRTLAAWVYGGEGDADHVRDLVSRRAEARAPRVPRDPEKRATNGSR